MKVVMVRQFHLSTMDINRLENLAPQCLLPYLKDDDASAVTNLKAYNSLIHKEKVFTEQLMQNVLQLCSDIKAIITNKKTWLKEEMITFPETSAGLITRPKDMANTFLDNYDYQLRLIGEIVEILSFVTSDEEDFTE